MPPVPPRNRAPRRFTILDGLLLIAGVAVGLWMDLKVLRQGPQEMGDEILLLVVFLLGGLSLIGPPLLLRERLHRRARLRIGELFWFCQGTASWLLWPPILIRRARGTESMGEMASVCSLYGTPLMALYVTLALLAGGWLRPRRRRPWTETFGLLLGMAWACTGLYVLSKIYHNDLFR